MSEITTLALFRTAVNGIQEPESVENRPASSSSLGIGGSKAAASPGDDHDLRSELRTGSRFDRLGIQRICNSPRRRNDILRSVLVSLNVRCTVRHVVNKRGEHGTEVAGPDARYLRLYLI